MLSPVTMHKAELYALDKRYLTDEDILFLMQNFGCSRKIYNLYVDALYKVLDERGYQVGNPVPDDIKFPEVSSFKSQFPYLKFADSLGLANAKISFHDAVKRYNKEYDHKSYTKRALRRAESGTEPLSFRGLKGMPKFHSKAHGDFSYTTNCQYPTEKNGLKQATIRLEKDVLYVPKHKSGFRLIVHRRLPKGARIGNVTFSMDSAGCFFASVEYSYILPMEISVREAVLSDDESIVNGLSFLGLDYSQQNFYVDSEGRKANYPRYYRKSEEKLAKLQRRLSHMQKGSSNYEKMRKRISLLHKKIANQRLDFVRKEACKLVKEYDVIVVEDINLRAMGETLHLAKNLHDNGFGMFRNILERKLEERGLVLVKIDKWEPSSKTCSICGFYNPNVVLGVSEWDCPVCGTHHDRDINAAINIRERGKEIFVSYFKEWLEEDISSKQRLEVMKKSRSEARWKKAA